MFIFSSSWKDAFKTKNYTSGRLVIIVPCFANAWKTTKMLAFSVKAYKIKKLWLQIK